MERMLFRSPKVTFGAFEDALDIRSAITAQRFRVWWSQECRDTVCYMSCSGESLVQLATSLRMIMALDGVDGMIIYRPAADSEALTTVYEKDHIEKTLPGLEPVYLTSRPVKMCDGTEAAMWVIEVRQGRMRSLSDPKLKILKLMPQSDGTFRRVKKRQVPQGLVAVEAKKESIAAVMKDFQAKGERPAAMEGFVPGAAVFFVEATPDLMATNIPKHMLTPYFAIMTVEEWAANSTAAYEFSYDVWAAGKARDATAPRVWSSMVGMMTELGMEWSAAVYRGTNKLQVGVKGPHNGEGHHGIWHRGHGMAVGIAY